MKKSLILLLITLFMGVTQAQIKIGGATLSNTQNFEGESLVLNGAGVREKYFMDMYAGGLYLKSKSSNANNLVGANEPMALKIHILSKLISSDKMIEAVDEGFKNTTKGSKANLSADIEKFKGFFGEEISKNDVFDIVFLPSKGVVVYKNGNQKGTIKGLEFKKALFGIWLSENPADKKLKQGMLGK